MIITQTPYRISLFGGSTDYSSFYSNYGSILVGMAIDKYCYTVCKKFPNLQSEINYQVYYSIVEKVKEIANISNPGVRGTLERYSLTNEIKNLAIYIQNDLPSQTGIGSSSSLIVGLLNNLYKGKKSKKELAKLAIQIERIDLDEKGGIQDQIFAAYGGFNKIEINRDGKFFVRPIGISEDFIKEFLDSSILFYTNGTRQSYKLAASHDNRSADKYKNNILDIAKRAVFYFESENIKDIGVLLDKSWQEKRQISSLISNEYIDSLSESIKKLGGFGCKLIGSGETGFMFCIVDKNKKQKIIDEIKLPTVNFNCDFEGSKLIFAR